MLVLIDTWWNVNPAYYSYRYKEALVLIDTWWNVNIASVAIDVMVRSGFNRYMVECECFYL